MRLIAAALLLAPAAAHGQDAPLADPQYDIVVRGDLPHCRTRPDDPLDRVDVDHSPFRQSVIEADARGVMHVEDDDDPILGPDVWQRAGTGIADFRFRAPTDGTPLCIGSWGKRPQGWGQLRHVVDARPLYGKYVRFTAFVATRRSDEVRFWLATGQGKGGRVLMGGDTANQPVIGTKSWIPVQLTIGPIPKGALKVSYGFLLMGAGDVWVNKPTLEVFDQRPATYGPPLNHVRQVPRGSGN